MSRRELLENVVKGIAAIALGSLFKTNGNEDKISIIQMDEILNNPDGDEIGWVDYDPTAKIATVDWSLEPKDVFLFGPNEGI